MIGNIIRVFFFRLNHERFRRQANHHHPNSPNDKSLFQRGFTPNTAITKVQSRLDSITTRFGCLSLFLGIQVCET